MRRDFGMVENGWSLHSVPVKLVERWTQQHDIAILAVISCNLFLVMARNDSHIPQSQGGSILALRGNPMFSSLGRSASMSAFAAALSSLLLPVVLLAGFFESLV